jgi:hypothetical protein
MADEKVKYMRFDELGTTGLKISAGYIFEEFLKRIQNYDERMRYYTEMKDNSATVGAFLFAFDVLIRQAEWWFDPVSNDQVDQDAADFMSGALFEDMSMSWPDTVSEILSMLSYGFSFHEIVYKMRLGPEQKDSKRRSKFSDGKIGIRKLPIRSQDSITRWITDEENSGLLAVEQQDPNTARTNIIPIEKGLLFRPKSYKNNPEGNSILRNSVTSWFFLKRIQEIEAIGIERDLAGLPVGYAPPEWFYSGASPEERAQLEAFKKLITGIKRDENEGVLIPSIFDDDGKNRLVDIQLMTTGGRRQFDTVKIKDGYKQDIATSVLADFLLLGQQAVGSFALSSSKTAIFAMAVGAWMDVITETVDRFLTPKLMRLNNFQVESVPKLMHSDIEDPDLAELGSFIQAVTGAGMTLFPDDAVENKIRTAAKLPLKVDE